MNTGKLVSDNHDCRLLAGRRNFMKFEIKIKTGYVEFGGTNAKVYITLHGSEKKSNDLSSSFRVSNLLISSVV